MSLSVYARNKILDNMLRGVAFDPTPVYISLHTGDPGVTGANEVTGGTYVRQASSSSNWSAAASAQSSNISSISFSGLTPALTITHVGMWDAVSGGNFLNGGALTAPRFILALEVDVFTPGALIAALSA
jgi:hypothetical protein